MMKNEPGSNEVVHFLWVYGDLGKLETLALQSWVLHNYKPVLWTYADKTRAPEGVQIRDANTIIKEGEVFLNRRSSYASFADLFRYTALSRLGGMWSDTDVICLQDISARPQVRFLTKEAVKYALAKRLLNRPTYKINNNVIYNPSPRRGDIIDLARAYAETFPKDEIFWDELGPVLLSGLARLNPRHGFALLDAEYANPVAYWKTPRSLLEPGHRLPTRALYLHCYNEMWKNSGVSKEDEYPRNSILFNVEKMIRKEYG